jgi:large subunit ribosomal protein L32e
VKALDELTDDQIKALIDAGYGTIDDLKGANVDELVSIAGFETDLAKRVARQLRQFKHKDLSAEQKHLLKVRKRHEKPWFKRDDYENKKKLGPSWRKPRGLFNKMRRGFPDKGAVVQAGYGAPTVIRGFHPSGFEEALVSSLGDLEKVQTEQAVRIARTVGARKRHVILERAFARGLKVLNPHVTSRGVASRHLSEEQTITEESPEESE